MLWDTRGYQNIIYVAYFQLRNMFVDKKLFFILKNIEANKIMSEYPTH